MTKLDVLLQELNGTELQENSMVCVWHGQGLIGVELFGKETMKIHIEKLCGSESRLVY